MPDASDLTPLGTAAPPPDVALAIRRDELAQLVASYQRAQPNQMMYMVPGLVGFGTGIVLMELAAGLRLPSVLQPIGFGIGWVIFLTVSGVMWMRERRRLARYRIDCPECTAPLIRSIGWGFRRDGVSRAQLAVATGCCPECGARILA